MTATPCRAAPRPRRGRRPPGSRRRAPSPTPGSRCCAPRGEHGPEIWCRCDGDPTASSRSLPTRHADALSVEVRHDGVEVLVDPGTYCYHGEPAWRSYFRSTLAHNTLEVAGASQAVEAGPFLWATQPHSEVVAVDVGPGRRQSWMGRHDGYARLHVTHTRTVYLDDSDAEAGDDRPGLGQGPARRTPGTAPGATRGRPARRHHGPSSPGTGPRGRSPPCSTFPTCSPGARTAARRTPSSVVLPAVRPAGADHHPGRLRRGRRPARAPDLARLCGRRTTRAGRREHGRRCSPWLSRRSTSGRGWRPCAGTDACCWRRRFSARPGAPRSRSWCPRSSPAGPRSLLPPVKSDDWASQRPGTPPPR